MVAPIEPHIITNNEIETNTLSFFEVRTVIELFEPNNEIPLTSPAIDIMYPICPYS